MTGEQTAKVLFWLGIIGMIVKLIAMVYYIVLTTRYYIDFINTLSSYAQQLVSLLWEGGLLIGVAKIIEIQSSKRT